jgi:dinuclear metal center YbgI/SA1388 family protein
MIHTAALIAELDAVLTPQEFADYGPNGLQVPNMQPVDTVATGVSASAELFERAAAAGAQLVLVHHGLWWRGMPQHIDRALHRRLKPLFDHDIALAAYHLPLDAHPEHGNNALLAEGLDLTDVTPFERIGMAGHFGEREGIHTAELLERVRRLTQREPLHLDFGPERIRSMAIVSGGASDYLGAAVAAGYDAFLTGEPAERVMTQAREAGIHFFGAGHYATETFGIRRMGDLLAERFGVNHVFLDDPNPI